MSKPGTRARARARARAKDRVKANTSPAKTSGSELSKPGTDVIQEIGLAQTGKVSSTSPTAATSITLTWEGGDTKMDPNPALVVWWEGGEGGLGGRVGRERGWREEGGGGWGGKGVGRGEEGGWGGKMGRERIGEVGWEWRREGGDGWRKGKEKDGEGRREGCVSIIKVHEHTSNGID